MSRGGGGPRRGAAARASEIDELTRGCPPIEREAERTRTHARTQSRQHYSTHVNCAQRETRSSCLMAPQCQWVLGIALSTVALAADRADAQADDPAHSRAVRLVAQMTLDEKLGFLQGCTHAGCRQPSNGGAYVGIVPGLPRLGIPDLRMNDGPEGFRGEPGTSTQWPSGLTVAHSWDPKAFLAWGTAMGREFSGKGANVQFGPGANLARVANGGRSFEYR